MAAASRDLRARLSLESRAPNGGFNALHRSDWND